MIGSEKSTEHRQRNEKVCQTHRESIRSEWTEKFSNKEKIRSLGYKFITRSLSNSSLFMEFRERCWPRKLRFLQTSKNNISRFLILPKMQTCMQKISKQLTTFTDNRRKGESLWLKKFFKKHR